MRKALIRYCRPLKCSNCDIEKHDPNHRCGQGTYFDIRNANGSYNMTDDEIRAAYAVVFRK